MTTWAARLDYTAQNIKYTATRRRGARELPARRDGRRAAHRRAMVVVVSSIRRVQRLRRQRRRRLLRTRNTSSTTMLHTGPLLNVHHSVELCLTTIHEVFKLKPFVFAGHESLRGQTKTTNPIVKTVRTICEKTDKGRGGERKRNYGVSVRVK